MVKLNSETYKGFVIEFTELFNNNKNRAVEVKIKENGKIITMTNFKTKAKGFNWARDYIDNNYKSNDGLEGWKKKAKQELEKELNVKTRVTNYDYYIYKDGLSLESISEKGNNGEREWIVFKDENVAERVAVDKVREDLEDEPYIFSQYFIENHIDTENLDNQLESDVDESSRSYYDDIESESDSTYGNRQIKELVEGGYLENNENWNNKDNTADKYENSPEYTTALDNAVENMTKDQLSNGGIEYLKDIMGDEDGIKKAIGIGGFDYDEASQDAVDTDGVAHFLDGYDGQEVKLPSGAVAYGTN